MKYRGHLIKVDSSTLAKMSFGRLRLHRSRVLAHITKMSGNWCCEHHCEWYEKEYPTKNEDYVYRDLVNKYYNAGKSAVKC